MYNGGITFCALVTMEIETMHKRPYENQKSICDLLYDALMVNETVYYIGLIIFNGDYRNVDKRNDEANFVTSHIPTSSHSELLSRPFCEFK